MEVLPPGVLLRDPRSPDLLDLRVVSADDRFIVVSIGGKERKYNRREARLRRWLLPARTAVAILPAGDYEPKRSGVVLGLRDAPESAEPWTYHVKTDRGSEEIPEQRLQVLKIDVEDPLARLQMNAWRGPRRFFARLGLLERTTVWKQDSEGIPAFLGARIEPLFHQFYAARRCLLDREARFLLADEVGLGKTVEAGLVIQSLLAAKPELRVLVVSPGTTSRQWLVELYSRFGGRAFTHVNAVRYRAATASRGAVDSLLEHDRLIVTTSLLRTKPKALSRLTEQRWDVLVVDEGHQLVNWPVLMHSLRHVSEAASSCLVLTATPGRGDDSGLLELLKLVAPATYKQLRLKEFAERLEPQRTIAEKLLFSEELIAAILSRGNIEREDARELAQEWRGLLPNDPIIDAALEQMDEGDGEAAEELVAHIQEHYRVDRRIIRTRRATLAAYGNHYSIRTLHHIEYDPSPAEVAVTEHVADLFNRTDVHESWKLLWSRLACTTPELLKQMLDTRLAGLAQVHALTPDESEDPLAADLGPAEEETAIEGHMTAGPTFPGEAAWLHETAIQVQRWWNVERQAPRRFSALSEWLELHIAAGARKILVFSQSRFVAFAFAKYLRSRLGEDAVAVMTHDLGDDEIADIARKFESRRNYLVLVSDEVGAEGQNFQFADAVVHLDQPSAVVRVEQRIGRLDRIGRRLERPVLSVAITGTLELERALLAINRDVFRVYERSIGGLEYLLPRFQRLITAAAARGPEALCHLQVELHEQLEAEERRVDEAFTFFLDATRPELERAKQLADLVADRSGEEDEVYVRDWCKELGIGFVPQEGECVKIEVRADRLDVPLRGIGARDWIRTGTFRRRVALDVPAVQYFAPGHVFIDALLHSALNTHDARATIFFRDLGPKAQGRVFCVVVGRLSPDDRTLAEQISPGVLRRAEHYLPVEWVRVAFEVLPNGEVVPIPPGGLFQELTKDLQPRDRKCYPDQLSQVLDHIPGLWVGLTAAVNAAQHLVLTQKKDEIAAAGRELEEGLRAELAYLRAHPDLATARVALQERQALLDSIRHPIVTGDALALVIGMDGR